MKALAPSLAAAALAACAHITAPPGDRPTRPRPAGSPAWMATARAELAAFDADRSGALEAAEVPALPCALLASLDADLHDRPERSLAVSLGLPPGLLWRGDQLGLDTSARAPLLGRLDACLGPTAASRRDDSALQTIAAVPDVATSQAWDAAVRDALVAAYDTDGSGMLDTPLELDAIPCALWLYLEGATLAERDRPLCVVYGLSDGYLFVGEQLGVAAAARADAQRAATGCGLAAD